MKIKTFLKWVDQIITNSKARYILLKYKVEK